MRIGWHVSACVAEYSQSSGSRGGGAQSGGHLDASCSTFPMQGGWTWPIPGEGWGGGGRGHTRQRGAANLSHRLAGSHLVLCFTIFLWPLTRSQRGASDRRWPLPPPATQIEVQIPDLRNCHLCNLPVCKHTQACIHTHKKRFFSTETDAMKYHRHKVDIMPITGPQ